MTLHVPKAVLISLLLGLAIGVGVVGTLIAVGGDEDRPGLVAAQGDSSADASLVTRPPAQARHKPKMPVRLTVHRTPRRTTEQSVTIRGRTTPGAKVTVRGRSAVVRHGIYRVRLKLRLGTNRFTVVARHPDRRTRRRPMKLDRVEPVLAHAEEGCGGDPYAYRTTSGACIGPAHPPSNGPASPEDCPAGQVPVGVTGACAAPDTVPTGPDVNGPDDPCPAGTNWVEPDGCVGGDY
jgi:hypothetical protein